MSSRLRRQDTAAEIDDGRRRREHCRRRQNDRRRDFGFRRRHRANLTALQREHKAEEDAARSTSCFPRSLRRQTKTERRSGKQRAGSRRGSALQAEAIREFEIQRCTSTDCGVLSPQAPGFVRVSESDGLSEVSTTYFSNRCALDVCLWARRAKLTVAFRPGQHVHEAISWDVDESPATRPSPGVSLDDGVPTTRPSPGASLDDAAAAAALAAAAPLGAADARALHRRLDRLEARLAHDEHKMHDTMLHALQQFHAAERNKALSKGLQAYS